MFKIKNKNFFFILFVMDCRLRYKYIIHKFFDFFPVMQISDFHIPESLPIDLKKQKLTNNFMPSPIFLFKKNMHLPC